MSLNIELNTALVVTVHCFQRGIVFLPVKGITVFETDKAELINA